MMTLFLLSGCSGGVTRFAGPLTTEQGACGPGFDAAGQARASLVVKGSDVQFAPSDGVVVLPGHVNDAGHVVASTNAMGADRKPFPQVFEGDHTGDRITGRFATPRCRATVVLTRQ
jgi:hypothetical protein